MTEIKFETYQRRPFMVEATKITSENIESCAHMLKSSLRTNKVDDGPEEIYISLNSEVVPQMPRAYVGWWITEMDGNFRCYSPRAFTGQFEPYIKF